MRRSDDGSLTYSPTDLVKFFRSPYVSWLERFNQTAPADARIAQDEDAAMALLSRRGDEFEARVLAEYKTTQSVVEIPRDDDFDASLRQTLAAMRAGAEVIYQGALRSGQFQGYTDFLVRVPGSSKLGDFTYEVYDTKLARRPKPEYSVQLNCYGEMLAEVLGRWPERWHVILGDQTVASFRTSDHRHYYAYLKQSFVNAQHAFDVGRPPLPEPWEKCVGYEAHVETLLRARDHLSLVAGVGTPQIKRFVKTGITTRTALAGANDADRPAGMNAETFAKLREQAQLQVQSQGLPRPAYRVLPHEAEIHRGLARLPPANEGDVIFDMEGDPLAEGGLEYLFGVLIFEKGKWVFKDWRAPAPELERNAFIAFVTWLIARLDKYPGLHVYHYANYEAAALAQLSNKYNCQVNEVDRVLRERVLVDLYKCVREGVRIGVESYSIKKLEPLYDFKRASAVTSAGDSVVQFNTYQDLAAGDAAARAEAARIFENIVSYNHEDVASTLKLLDWLRARAVDAKIAYAPEKPSKTKSEPATWEATFDGLITSPPQWLKTDEDLRVNAVVAGLSGYFHREDRPLWWEFFAWHDTDPAELFDDPSCLVDGVVTAVTGKRAEITFDVHQPLKIKRGASLTVHGERTRASLVEIDVVNGRATVSLPRAFAVGESVSLVPGGPLQTDVQKKLLIDLATRWRERGPAALSSAARDLLYRTPRVQGIASGSPLYAAGTDVVTAATEIAARLDGSILAVQGPPGTGKTFAGTRIACRLVADGQRVAVVSQGKKTVENLLGGLREAWAAGGYPGPCPPLHMADKDRGGDAPHPHLTYHENSAARGRQSQMKVLGGTHWVFGHEDLVDEPFDYLIVDEAGQFALAALLACSVAARNIILLGDQMQLEQVNTGVHPEPCGQSALGYFVNDQRTVSRERGVFLDRSWRMHPDLCAFISEAVYENRLSAVPATREHRLEFKGKSPLPAKGVVFLSVAHEGNSTHSVEEAERIAQVLTELKRATVPDGAGKRRQITNDADDVIVITPYNAQVEVIRARSPGLKVGTVDRFQGQEAWVSILSMCASGEDDLRRGLEFLLSKNRLNVGLSRAKALAIVVGSPRLLEIRPTRMESVELLNFYARLMEKSER